MKKVIRIFLINLLILIILLFCFEIVLRIKGDTYTWTEKGRGIYLDPWESDSKARFQLRTPGVNIEEYPEFRYVINVNEDGVRDVSHHLIKPANTLRILGLGDSFMEGMGSDFDSTIMSLLKSKLNSKNTFNGIEVLSGGVAGSDVFRSYNLLSEKLQKYCPDFVIILMNNTDISDWVLKGNEDNTRLALSQPSRLNRWFFRYSHLYRSITINLLGYNWLQQSPREQKLVWEGFKKDFERVVFKYAQIVEKNKLIFVFHPLIDEYTTSKYYYAFDDLFQILKRQGIKKINSMLCLKDANAISSEIYWREDMHFNARGYNLISDCIVESNFITP